MARKKEGQLLSVAGLEIRVFVRTTFNSFVLVVYSAWVLVVNKVILFQYHTKPL